MRQPVTGIIPLLLLASNAALGQNADARLEFEVASIKASPPLAAGGRMMFGFRGGPGTPDPGQITYTGLALKFILMNAYDVRPYQVTGPAWLDTERFDIVAKVPPGTTKDQARTMLQNLLADRFGLKLHHETKDAPVYEFVVDKNGPKFKPSAMPEEASAPKPEAPPPPPAPPKLDKNGFPQLEHPGLVMMMTMGPNGPRSRMAARAQSMADFARALGNQVNRPVVDKTGLTGKYDFNLESAFEPGAGGPMGLPPPPLPPGAAGAGPGPSGPLPAGPLDSQPADSAPSIFTAVQEQLGLKLEQKRAPLDLLVIDHIEKTPTEN